MILQLVHCSITSSHFQNQVTISMERVQWTSFILQELNKWWRNLLKGVIQFSMAHEWNKTWVILMRHLESVESTTQIPMWSALSPLSSMDQVFLNSCNCQTFLSIIYLLIQIRSLYSCGGWFYWLLLTWRHPRNLHYTTGQAVDPSLNQSQAVRWQWRG